MVYRFTTIKEDFTIAGVESSVPMSDDNLRPAHRVQVSHRNESERNARAVLGRLVVGKADLLRREAESGGDPVLMRGRSRKLRQFRHIELGIRGVPAAASHAHADAADPFFQDYEGVAIGGGSRNPVIGKLDGRAELVGWPANCSSVEGEKMRTWAVCDGRRGGSTNTVSDRLNSRAMACMASVLRPPASKTTASGFPARGVLVKTSQIAYRRSIRHPWFEAICFEYAR